MVVLRVFYKCWEAMMTLLEILGCLNNNSEQPRLLSSSLPPRSTSEDDTYYGDEPSTSLVETGVFLDRIVQSPIQLSPAFRFGSPSMLKTNGITDFSTEILLEIFRYLAVIEASDEETASPLVLECLRPVCRRWRAIVDHHYRGRFLTATPGFLVHDPDDELPAWSRRFDAWCNVYDTGSALDIVSFYLCNHFASSWYALNVEHARIFTQALTKCRTARVVIDLTEAELNRDVFTKTTLPAIPTPLRIFSWTSEHMGIRHILPEVYQFPWLTLWQDMPWQQLTHVDLDCPLSLSDAYHVLAHGTNLTDARLATLKLADDPNQGLLPLFYPASSPLLRSLTIHSQLDLHMLFSNLKLPKLTCFSLYIFHPHSSLALVFQDSGRNFDLSLNLPWEQIEELDILYESGHQCDVAHALSNYRLRKLALAGNLAIQNATTNFVRRLDNVTFDVGIIWDQPSDSLKETTIKKLQITRATARGLEALTNLKAINELSIIDPINLDFLLAILSSVPSLSVGKFHVIGVSSQAMEHQGVSVQNLRRLDITTEKSLIQLVSATLKSKMANTFPTFIISVHE